MARNKRLASPGEAAVSPAAKKKTVSQHSTDSARATRSMTRDAPRQAVFNTTELLEAIMLCLPPKFIFGIQRVNQQFRNLIASSVRIQQKLFLRTCVEQEVWILRLRDPLGENPSENSDSSADSNESVDYEDEGSESSGDSEYELVREADNVADAIGSPVQPVMLCPFVTPDFDGTSAAARLGESEVEEFHFNIATLATRPGSWQAVQLTDPPCKELEATVDFSLYTYPDEVYSFVHAIGISSESGITLGQLSHTVMKTEQDIDRLPRAGDYLKGASSQSIMEKAKRRAATGKARLREVRVSVMVEGVIVPTAEEWDDVKKKATEAES